eukprot:scaffold11629_cov131-Isochrysis_galbana.AAC.3
MTADALTLPTPHTHPAALQLPRQLRAGHSATVLALDDGRCTRRDQRRNQLHPAQAGGGGRRLSGPRQSMLRACTAYAVYSQISWTSTTVRSTPFCASHLDWLGKRVGWGGGSE